MADRRISELPAIFAVAGDDALAIVDTSLSETNKVSVEDLLRSAPAGTAAAPSIAFVDDPDTGFYRSAANELSISTGGSQRVVVDDAGNVGIGTSNPGSLLHLKSTTAEIIQTMETSTGTVKLYANNDDFIVDADQHRYRSEDGATEYMRISSVGRVGIGTSSPGSPLEVQTASGERITLDSAGASQQPRIGLIRDAGVDYFIQNSQGLFEIKKDSDYIYRYASETHRFFTAGAGERMRIGSTGLVGIGTSSPAYALDVAGPADNTYVRIRTGSADTHTAGVIFGDSNSTAPGYFNYNNADSSLAIGVNSAERMRIRSNGVINFANCPTYADDTAAGTGGLVAGDVYKTSTGELRIKL